MDGPEGLGIRSEEDSVALGHIARRARATAYEGLREESDMETIDMMHTWIAANGYGVRGRHHELYLSDPNRTAPEKMKTILRLPVQKVQS